jgi:hypothetical protein
VIIRSLNSKFKDFEDALQNYAAEIDKEIDVILTRNSKDFKNSSLLVMTPDNYIKIKNLSNVIVITENDTSYTDKGNANNVYQNLEATWL